MFSLLSIKRLTMGVFLIASASLAWQCYRIQLQSIRAQWHFEEFGIILCRFGPTYDELSRCCIELLLLLAFLGSESKGIKSTLLTVIGLSGAALIYIYWWQYIFWLEALAGSEVWTLPNLAYLYGGNYLDLVIAGSVAVLILMNVLTAALRFKDSTLVAIEGCDH